MARARTSRGPNTFRRHCEERSDEAVDAFACCDMDCFASLAMTLGVRRRLPDVAPSHRRGDAIEPDTDAASFGVWSSFLAAPKMMIPAPGLSSDLSPVTKATMECRAAPQLSSRRPLYLTRMFRPSVPASVGDSGVGHGAAGQRSQGRNPSASPRWASGKM